MSRLNKTFAVLGMLLFFVVGAVAVSLAHDAPSCGAVRTNALRRAVKYGPAQVDRYTLRIGMDSETGILPNSAQPVLKEFQVLYSQLLEPLDGTVLIPIHPVNVSIQILDSVLLL